MANLGSMGLSSHLAGLNILKKPASAALPTPTSPKLPAPAGRSEGWSPTATSGSVAPGALAPKTDTAALPGMITPYKGYEITSAAGGGWVIVGKIPGAPFGLTGPLNAFPSGTSMDAMKAWVDRRIATVKPTVTPQASTTAAKQESLPTPTQDAKGVPVSPSPVPEIGPITMPDATPSGAAPATGMKTGTKVALGAGAGLLAILALRG